MNLAERLEVLRAERGNLEYQEIARATGISKASITNYFTNERIPRVPELAKLANYFGVTMDYLFHGRKLGDSNLEPAELRDAPPPEDAEIWRKRAKAAENKLARAQEGLRELLREMSDSPETRDAKKETEEGHE